MRRCANKTCVFLSLLATGWLTTTYVLSMPLTGSGSAKQGLFSGSSTTDSGKETTTLETDWMVELANSIIARQPDPTSYAWNWGEGVLMAGMWKVYEETGDTRYFDYVKSYVDKYVSSSGSITAHIDNTAYVNRVAPAMVLPGLYEVTHQSKYLTAANTVANYVRTQCPRTSDGALVHLEGDQLWADTMFMACVFLARLGKLTGNNTYLNEAANQILLHANHLFDPDDKLFYHGWDQDGSAAWADPTTHQSPCFWGRGNGWVSMTMLEVLQCISPSHPQRAQILALFQAHASGIAACQASTGRWYTVLDRGGETGNYQETSATAMFTYGFELGARKGYISNSYKNVASSGNNGLNSKIVMDGSGLTVVKGTSRGTVVSDYAYYISVYVANNELWGMASVLFMKSLYRPAVAPAPNIQCTPGTKDYGSVQVGTKVSHTFVVHNSGNATLNISSTTTTGTDSADFNITSGDGAYSLTPGASQNVIVDFSPTWVGTKSASLKIMSNDPDQGTLIVALSGTGALPRIQVSPQTIDFGNVRKDSSAVDTVVILNPGEIQLSVISTTILGNESAQFCISEGGGTSVLDPGLTMNILLRFTPSAIGSSTAVLRITSNDPDNGTVLIQLSGTGVAPDLCLNCCSIDFGNVRRDGLKTDTLYIQNTGNCPLVIGSTTLVGTDSCHFCIAGGGGTFSVVPGDSHEVRIQFNPSSTGAKTAALMIASDDPDQALLDVPLSGTGVVPSVLVDRYEVDFGNVKKGRTESAVIFVLNQGDYLLSVNATEITGTDSVEFSIIEGAGPYSLAAGDSQDVVIGFSPAETGFRSAYLRILSDDPENGILSVPLIGRGAVPRIHVAQSVDFEEVKKDSSAIQTLSIANEGDYALTVVAFNLTGTDASQFAVRNGLTPFVVSPGDYHDILLQYAPQDTGSHQAQLIILSDDPDQSQSDIELTGRCTADPQPLPEEFRIHQNYPNPFNPCTWIEYEVPKSGRITIEVLNLRGERIKTLYNGDQTAGGHETSWDGTDERGSLVSSGSYLIVLRYGSKKTYRKVLLIR